MTKMTIDGLSRSSVTPLEITSRAPSMLSHLDESAHGAGQKLGAMASDVARSATEYVKNTREYVQENPIKGVAYAAAAGALAGSLLTFALRRRS